jgi:hypothetical protein
MYKAFFSVIILSCLLFAQNDQVSLSGKVTGAADGKGLAGVTVALKNLPALSATSLADGSFSIISGTGVLPTESRNSSMQLVLKGKTVVLSIPATKTGGNLAIYSSSGRMMGSTRFSNRMSENARVALPDLGAGIYLVRVTVGDAVFQRSLVCMGGDAFMENKGLMEANGASLLLAKGTAAVVDTIIASKSGFVTKMLPIAAYTMADIEIALQAEAAGGACTRESLQELVNGFVAALAAADPTEMSLDDGATYIENMKKSAFDAGVWKNKLKVGFHRDFFDVDSCKIFTEVMDYESAEPHEVGAQIRVNNGKITEISALVSSVGDWALDNASSFKFRYDISSNEKWDIIPEASRDDRETIQAAGDLYLDLFNDTSVKVPWGMPCARLEGGWYTGNKNNLNDPNTTCNSGVPSGLLINARTYIVDVDLGTVSIFCKFGGSMPDSHLFRIEGGKLRYVHTISIN